MPPALAEALAGHPDLVDCLYLVGNGVPFDVAFSLPRGERRVWVIVMGTVLGQREYDWRAGEWRA